MLGWLGIGVAVGVASMATTTFLITLPLPHHSPTSNHLRCHVLHLRPTANYEFFPPTRSTGVRGYLPPIRDFAN